MKKRRTIFLCLALAAVILVGLGLLRGRPAKTTWPQVLRDGDHTVTLDMVTREVCNEEIYFLTGTLRFEGYTLEEVPGFPIFPLTLSFNDTTEDLGHLGQTGNTIENGVLTCLTQDFSAHINGYSGLGEEDLVSLSVEGFDGAFTFTVGELPQVPHEW